MEARGEGEKFGVEGRDGTDGILKGKASTCKGSVDMIGKGGLSFLKRCERGSTRLGGEEAGDLSEKRSTRGKQSRRQGLQDLEEFLPFHD